MTQSTIVSADRGTMKVYAARDYIDADYRKTNYVEVNAPEFLPTTPKDDEEVDFELPKVKDYVLNCNYPELRETVSIQHFISLPIYKGTYAPVRFNKGAEFLLIYPTSQLEAGSLIFIQDVEKGT